MVLNPLAFRRPNYGMHFLKKLGKLPLLMSSNVLSRDGMGLAVNVICANDLPPLKKFLNLYFFLPHAFFTILHV